MKLSDLDFIGMIDSLFGKTMNSPLVQVPLDGVLSRSVNHITQLGVIGKFDEGALDPFICVSNEGIE